MGCHGMEKVEPKHTEGCYKLEAFFEKTHLGTKLCKCQCHVGKQTKNVMTTPNPRGSSLPSLSKKYDKGTEAIMDGMMAVFLLGVRTGRQLEKKENDESLKK
jgi:hypothetical protein